MKESFHKQVEYDRPGERSPVFLGLLLTVIKVSTTRAVVILRVKVSCMTDVDGIKLRLWSFCFAMLLVIGRLSIEP